MTQVGTASQPLRVAVVGSGPAAFYAAEQLFKQSGLVVEVDMFERLPTPFGLVRYGVAPDHAKIKTVTRERSTTSRRTRAFVSSAAGIRPHVTLPDLQQHYHGRARHGRADRRHWGFPAKTWPAAIRPRSSSPGTTATPITATASFDLSVERAAVVGVGNVAIDVARILVRTPEELAKTDIAAHALDALRNSRITEVFLLGRRGPAQAAFTNPEVKEIGEMADADVTARPEEVQLDPLTEAQLAAGQDRTVGEEGGDPAGLRAAKTARQEPASPAAIPRLAGGARGRRRGPGDAHAPGPESARGLGYGRASAQATDQFEDLDVGLVFRSVGYRGVALPGVPFHERWGVIVNEKGRVLDPDTKKTLTGVYATGWIKRGPSGVIGTNKPDAVETVTSMLEDLAQGAHWSPAHADAAAAAALVQVRQPLFVTYDDWRRLDALELVNGQSIGRPRLKFAAVDQMLAALGRAVPVP